MSQLETIICDPSTACCEVFPEPIETLGTLPPEAQDSPVADHFSDTPPSIFESVLKGFGAALSAVSGSACGGQPPSDDLPSEDFPPTDYSSPTPHIEAEVPNRPPNFVSISRQNISEGEELNLVARASDPDGDPVSLEVLASPNGLHFNEETGVIDWVPEYDQSGSHEVRIQASDGELSSVLGVSIIVQNVNRPPNLSPLPDRTVDEGSSIEFRAEASDPDGDPVTYSLVNPPAGSFFDTTTGSFSWTPPFSADRVYEMTLKARDEMDESSDNF
ncbi:MAG: Ig-like domain-containing protein, partial [bacterium]|nr:Ig-like domain-containing protein [bacterium]